MVPVEGSPALVALADGPRHPCPPITPLCGADDILPLVLLGLLAEVELPVGHVVRRGVVGLEPLASSIEGHDHSVVRPLSSLCPVPGWLPS